ncbi:MAG TPA: hypothetical protein VFW80_04760, partial [Gaiellaceae bacterium]|nr:hypothetical protein [Gaiellaceae bacterium]
VYLYDAAAPFVDYLAALDDATAKRLTVGVAGGLVDVCVPLQWNFHAPLVVEVLDGEPAPDLDDWEHVVEFPLQLPTGRLRVEGAGGSGERELELPAGAYAARWSGRDFPERGEYVPDASSRDGYRLQLWPSAAAPGVLELKRWPGYDALRAAGA